MERLNTSFDGRPARHGRDDVKRLTTLCVLCAVLASCGTKSPSSVVSPKEFYFHMHWEARRIAMHEAATFFESCSKIVIQRPEESIAEAWKRMPKRGGCLVFKLEEQCAAFGEIQINGYSDTKITGGSFVPCEEQMK